MDSRFNGCLNMCLYIFINLFYIAFTIIVGRKNLPCQPNPNQESHMKKFMLPLAVAAVLLCSALPAGAVTTEITMEVAGGDDVGHPGFTWVNHILPEDFDSRIFQDGSVSHLGYNSWREFRAHTSVTGLIWSFDFWSSEPFPRWSMHLGSGDYQHTFDTTNFLYNGRLSFNVSDFFHDESTTLDTLFNPNDSHLIMWIGIGEFAPGRPDESFRYMLDNMTLTMTFDTIPPAAAPIPAGFWLLGSGLAGMLALKRGKKA